MTKDVIVSIAGLKYEEENETIETVSTGKYSFKNGKHFVQYEELLDTESSMTETVACVLKFSDNCLEVIKRGKVGVHMFFELDKNHMTYYSTPYGDLMLQIGTKKIEVTESEEMITIDLNYSLDVNYEFVSDCDLKIKIRKKA